MKSEDWWLTLHKYLQVDSNNIEAIVGKLDNWIEQLDSIDNSQHPDVGSVICTILWLASKNLSQCVKIVQTWLTNKNELSRLVGAACGKTLFRVYAHCDPLPSVESFSLLLELVPLLGKQGWNGAEAVLYAAQRWAVQPEWFERLLTRPEGESGELIQLIETVLPEHYDVLSATLDDWGKSLDSEDEENAPAPVIKLTERLQLCVSINMRKTLPDLSEGHSYGLIVLDASDRNNHARNYFSGIASNVIKRLNKRDHETIDLMVYRMGEDYPVAIPGQEPAPEILLPPDLRRPRLLYPLMEIHSIQKVSFILLLTNRSILDQDDWIDSHWNELISLYTQVNDPPWAKPFILIPKQSNPDDAVSVILRHLEQKIGV
ncbi:MAG: hypothetical protein GY751_24405 [Bacteroidetes bacterium]|nr:hypothetical protein [Bacteroidota bacterium]